ncbi:hypothetical protein GQ457_07G029740 [Hibiscus cannabinus]
MMRKTIEEIPIAKPRTTLLGPVIVTQIGIPGNLEDSQSLYETSIERSTCTKPGIPDMESGIDPDNELEAKDRFFNDTKSPNSAGISPFSPFEERFKNPRSSRRVREIQMQVPRKKTGKISMRNGERLQLMHVPQDYINTAGTNRSLGNREISEVNETREPDARETAERSNAGEGSEGKGEIGREADRGYAAVSKRKRTEGREGLESIEGE